jgi:hypothetical protein
MASQITKFKWVVVHGWSPIHWIRILFMWKAVGGNFCKYQCTIILQKMDVMKSHLLEYCGFYYGSNCGGLEVMFEASILALFFWMMRTKVMNFRHLLIMMVNMSVMTYMLVKHSLVMEFWIRFSSTFITYMLRV